jgi:hypothetical protein
MNLGLRNIFFRNEFINKLNLDKKYYNLDELKNILINKYKNKLDGFRIKLNEDDCKFYGIHYNPDSEFKYIRISILLTIILKNFEINTHEVNKYIYNCDDKPLNNNLINIEFLKY